MSRKEPKEYLMIMQDIAEKNGGKLLSTIWSGTTQKYSFCFASGNEFEMIYKNIIKS